MVKKETNPSNTVVTEVMIIPHINIKSPSTFYSENLRTKKEMENPFSGLTQKIDLIYLL